MKLPKRVHINGKFWKVKEVLRVSKGDLGKIDALTKTILIKKKQTDIEKKYTLVHEMFHGFMWWMDEACIEQLAIDVVDALESIEE